jgi:excisionase family DNA binding protein
VTAPKQRRRWLSVDQTATELGVSRMSVYRLINRKELRAYRIGRILNVDPDDITTYLRSVSTLTRDSNGGGAA